MEGETAFLFPPDTTLSLPDHLGPRDPGLDHLSVVSRNPNTEQEVWTLAPSSNSCFWMASSLGRKKQISLLCGPSWEVKLPILLRVARARVAVSKMPQDTFARPTSTYCSDAQVQMSSFLVNRSPTLSSLAPPGCSLPWRAGFLRGALPSSSVTPCPALIYGEGEWRGCLSGSFLPCPPCFSEWGLRNMLLQLWVRDVAG